MTATALFLLTLPATPDWGAVRETPPGVRLTQKEAEERAYAWWAGPGRWTEPPVLGRFLGQCAWRERHRDRAGVYRWRYHVGVFSKVRGAGKSYKDAFQDARANGWDPANGYDPAYSEDGG